MIRHSHLCASCRLCVKQLPAVGLIKIHYWCTRKGNIGMVGAVKWMPVEHQFGCRFWVEKALGERRRVIDANGKRVGNAVNNARVIQYALSGVSRILDLRNGGNNFEYNENLTRIAINEMLAANMMKEKWTSREIVQWFLDNGKPIILPECYVRLYRVKNPNGDV
jgi:hypothetical protein